MRRVIYRIRWAWFKFLWWLGFKASFRFKMSGETIYYVAPIRFWVDTHLEPLPIPEWEQRKNEETAGNSEIPKQLASQTDGRQNENV